MSKPKKETKDRNMTIDTLRAISIVVMMVMHVNAYYLNNKFSLFFWTYSQWVVPAFIFCSFVIGKYEVTSLGGYLSYVIKRFRRILVPYYAWLLIYLSLIFLVERKVSLSFILKNILLSGGSDFNWLILLFVYITLFGPLISFAVNKSTKAVIALILSGLFFSIIVFFNQGYWKNIYKLVMFLPWVSITTILLLVYKLYKDKKYYMASLFPLAGVILFASMQLLVIRPQGIRLDLFYHKYPPNIYFFAYCLFATPIAFFISTKAADILEKKAEHIELIKHVLVIVSAKSYDIFFAHNIVLYLLSKLHQKTSLSYQQFLLLLFVFTFLLTRLIDVLQNKTSNLRVFFTRNKSHSVAGIISTKTS